MGSLICSNKGIRNGITAGEMLAAVYNEIADQGENAILTIVTAGASKFFVLGVVDEVHDTVKLIKNGKGIDIQAGDNGCPNPARAD